MDSYQRLFHSSFTCEYFLNHYRCFKTTGIHDDNFRVAFDNRLDNESCGGV